MSNHYIAAFKANHDYLSENRISRVRNETQEFFQIGEWLGYHERTIEQVKYFSQTPGRAIKEIEYEGWRRYVESRRDEEGGRILLHVKNLEVQATLARSIENANFKTFGWLEPIRVTQEDPMICVNFCENKVETNADYIDNFFQDIAKVQVFPKELMTDLKNVIAYNNVDRFKRKLQETDFATALPLIRPTSLEGVASPYFVAALYCRDSHLLSEARELIRLISKKHRQFEEGRQLERALYEKEIRDLKKELQQFKAKFRAQQAQEKPTSTPTQKLDFLHQHRDQKLRSFLTEESLKSEKSHKPMLFSR